jgi:hypothetical protein
VAIEATHITCTLEEYHARDEWSNSQISDLISRGAPFFHGTHVTGKIPKEQKAVWDIGTVAHAVFASEDMNKVVAIIPDDVLNSQGHRKGGNWLAWKEENEGLYLLKKSEMAPIIKMVANAHAHPAVKELLDHAAHFEHSLTYEDEATGLKLRCRSDLICVYPNGRAAVVDFKTTRAVTKREFRKDAFKFGYHRQAAWYWDAAEKAGFDVKAFVFVASDKSPANECRVYKTPPRELELGRREVRRALDDLARRLEEDDWQCPNYGEIADMEFPDYAFKDEGGER